MNIPNVFEFDIEIPAGKVALKEPRQMTENDRRVKMEKLDTGKAWGNVSVNLFARYAGWNIAGSMMRWDNGAFGVIWEANDGSQHGRWYKSFDEAISFFNKITA